MTIETSIVSSYQALRDRGAWWCVAVEPFALKGKDAASYLQTQITQDVQQLAVGQGTWAALVNRKGHLQSYFSLYRKADTEFWLFPTAQSEALFNHLEAFHFVEDVELLKLPYTQALCLEGPEIYTVLQQLSGKKLNATQRGQLHSLAMPGGSAWAALESLSGENGVKLYSSQGFEALTQILEQQFQLPPLAAEALEMARVEAGWPQYGVDWGTDTLLPETGLEKQAVAYDKGCYLGQEVIARIKTYGQVPSALMGFALLGRGAAEKPDLPTLPAEFQIEGKAAGRLTSVAWSPFLQQWLALGYLKKKWRENGAHWQLQFTEAFAGNEAEAQQVEVQVYRLPVYIPADDSQHARHLLEKALDVFAEDDENAAIPLLQSAIAKDPQLADAYEALGVILSRQGRYDEAIAVMLELTQVAPEEPMAHTNLSRFYMLQGDKDTAEKHMAEATRMSMLKTQKDLQAAQLAEQEKARKLEMMAMFREVLESEDPNDLVANFGLGKALADLQQYAEAEPYLAKAVEVDKLYSAAYLQWGKVLEQLQQVEQAKSAYQRGIEVAAEKGDLMPKKEMEQRLLVLESR